MNKVAGAVRLPAGHSAEFKIEAWTETSSAETGSSESSRSGLAAKGSGDGYALFFAAAELIRPALGVSGRQFNGHAEQIDAFGTIGVRFLETICRRVIKRPAQRFADGPV